MGVDSFDKCGIEFGTSGGEVYASADTGKKPESDCAGFA
jgi:hypothetical protein